MTCCNYPAHSTTTSAGTLSDGQSATIIGSNELGSIIVTQCRLETASGGPTMALVVGGVANMSTSAPEYVSSLVGCELDVERQTITITASGGAGSGAYSITVVRR